jgi:KDO2-lipid IV(A) lauroyltransferase
MRSNGMATKSSRYLFEYALFRALAFTARTLPRTTALRFGQRLGDLSRLVQKKRAVTATENLRRAYPEKSPAEIETEVRAVFRHLGVSGIEMLRLDLFRGQADLDRYFTFSGLEHLRQAYALNRGVLLLSGHIGFWEVGTFFMPTLGYPVDFVAKRMKNPHVDRYFEKLREAGGGRCLESKKGARRILRSLKENRAVAVLLDQHITRSEAVPVPFFGRQAWTTPIIAQIAMKQGVPIVPVYAYRTEDFRYQVVIEPIIQLYDEPGQQAVIRNTARLTANIEQAVRRHPRQWFWVHRRWRD